MTKEQCEVCKYAPPYGTYSTCSGDDLPVWTCDKIDDPRMPFDMEDDTDCPCFERIKDGPGLFKTMCKSLLLHIKHLRI